MNIYDHKIISYIILFHISEYSDDKIIYDNKNISDNMTISEIFMTTRLF